MTGAALYLAFGNIWIMVSDGALAVVSRGNPTLLSVGQSGKGFAFVALSAALVLLLIRRSRRDVANVTAELGASNRLRAELLDALPDPIVTMDIDGRVVSANRAAADACGYLHDEIIGRPMQSFVGSSDHTLVEKSFDRLLNGQAMSVEAGLLRRDGSVLPFEFHGVPLRDSHGAVVGAISTGRNIGERIRMQAILSERLSGLETTLRQTIDAIATMLEKRDPYLGGHQDRVTRLALAIADKLGLDADRRQGLEYGSRCHDIGKIQVPSDILSKPGRLSEAEYGIVRQHARSGYEILRQIEFPWPVAEIVHQHHERLDGSGYPQGLTGDRILLQARILGVADTVEAMMSHRPYRPGLGRDAARAEISKGRGILYDSAVVDACLELLSDKMPELSQPDTGKTPGL